MRTPTTSLPTVPTTTLGAVRPPTRPTALLLPAVIAGRACD